MAAFVALVLQGPKMQRRSRDRPVPFFLTCSGGRLPAYLGTLARPKTIDSLDSFRNSARPDDKSSGCGAYKSEW